MFEWELVKGCENPACVCDELGSEFTPCDPLLLTSQSAQSAQSAQATEASPIRFLLRFQRSRHPTAGTTSESRLRHTGLSSEPPHMGGCSRLYGTLREIRGVLTQAKPGRTLRRPKMMKPQSLSFFRDQQARRNSRLLSRKASVVQSTKLRNGAS